MSCPSLPYVTLQGERRTRFVDVACVLDVHGWIGDDDFCVGRNTRRVTVAPQGNSITTVADYDEESAIALAAAIVGLTND